MSPQNTPSRISTGARIRELRLAQGRAQAEMAHAAGISPAYLNLIEHDRRSLTAPVRARLAEALGTTEEELEAGREELLLAGLRVAAAAAPDNIAVEAGRMAEFATRMPGWAGLVVALTQQADGLERRLAGLSDRMTRNPYLLDTLHEVLSAVTSLRSTASILVQEPEMTPDWRARFHGNLDQDSRRLSVTAQALVAYLESFEQDAALLPPQEEFEAWIAEGRPAEGPATDAARDLARDWSEVEAADRAALPDERLAGAEGADPMRLAVQQDKPLDLVLRRLAGIEPDSGLLICDGAGGVIFRRPARGMGAFRAGDPCAMLPIFEALAQPGAPVERLIETETGQRLRALAIARRLPAASIAAPVLSRAVMLMRPVAEEDGPAIPVGPTCRICPRSDCPGRRVASILQR